MIASVRGPVQHVGLERVVIELGGLGVLVHTTPSTAAACHRGQEAALSTSLVVREDSLTLFGFASNSERDMFQTVQTVSGVGPRLALAMLSVLAPDRIQLAISTGDVKTLTKVPGIGTKGAERMVLELRDKIGMPSTSSSTDLTRAPAAPWRDQVVEALTGLGWSAKQASDAVDRVAPAAGSDVDISAILRSALRELGR